MTTEVLRISVARDPLGLVNVSRVTLRRMARDMKAVLADVPLGGDDAVGVRGWSDSSGAHLSFAAGDDRFVSVSEYCGDGWFRDHVGGGVYGGFMNRIVAGEMVDAMRVTFVSGGVWVAGGRRRTAAAWTTDTTGDRHWELRRRARLRGGRRIVTNRDRIAVALRGLGLGGNEVVSVMPWASPRFGSGIVLMGDGGTWRHVRCESGGGYGGGTFCLRLLVRRLSAALFALRANVNVHVIVPEDHGGDVRVRGGLDLEQTFIIGQEQ